MAEEPSRHDGTDIHIYSEAGKLGRELDARHSYIASRQWVNVDAHINGTMASALYRWELMRRVPFRSAE